ncbi:nuclear transport factor 2 family protein [Terricaulis silvestris]|uniref:SnoaL-like domain-containing protein n=1 Tax=Terricaulis silvestris TaxID=2686094 RepID=A0A6I6MHD2_9CAUL|nr:nuclear transport factor 2 family protein [Terricaulis silvestris]QGZ94265.1 hypothetical protein DSM104635_01081 [Terricaulis silvestris]
MTQPSPALLAWHARFMEALCARDANVYLAFLAPECTITINNALPTYAKAAIERVYSVYLALFKTLTADVLNIHGDEHSLSVEALLNYTLNDGSSEVVQCAWFLTRDDAGLITAVRVYGNASRVFKPFIPTAK